MKKTSGYVKKAYEGRKGHNTLRNDAKLAIGQREKKVIIDLLITYLCCS